MPSARTFNYFLSDLLDSAQYQAADLSRQAGIDPSEISKIKRGRRVGSGVAERIIGVLKPADRAEATANWLSDQVPDSLRRQVTVLPKSSTRVAEKPPQAGTLEGALEILRVAAKEDQHVRAVLTNLARVWQA